MYSRFITIARHLAIGILCMSLASASAQENQDKNVMLDKLEGSWILDSIEMRGEKRQGEELPARSQGMKQTIKGDTMIVSRVDGMQFECRIVVRGKAEPYELDIIQEDREGKKKILKCIFRLVDQTLVLAEGKDERPTSFETSLDVGTKVSTFTLKRPFGQSVVTFKIPESLESIQGKEELRYCSQWLSCEGGKVAQGNLLLESLEKDKIEIPYRWRSAFEVSLESDYQGLKSGGLNAAIVLPVRRKHDFEDVGEVLLLKKRLTISLIKNSGFGGGYLVPEAVLDRENCYLIANEPRSQLVITSLESKAGTKLWETTVPLVYSPGGQTGGDLQDGFQDAQFVDREGERVLFLWNHFAGEFAFAEISCSNGSVKTWFSSEIAIQPNLTQKTRTK